MKEINGLKMYTSQELCELLGITHYALTNLRRKGLIRSVYVGRGKYTSEEALREYLNGKIEPKKAESK